MQEPSSLLIEQNGALGGSAHPTTVLAIEWLSERLPILPDSLHPLLDYGCGSGVLSLIAAHLSARAIIGCDRDRQALDSARQHARRNGLEDRLRFLRAELPTERAIRDAAPYGAIVANILAEILLPMLIDFRRLLADDGEILFSGILRWQEKGFAEGCAAAGLMPLWRRQEGDWVALAARPIGACDRGRSEDKDSPSPM